MGRCKRARNRTESRAGFGVMYIIGELAAAETYAAASRKR